MSDVKHSEQSEEEIALQSSDAAAGSKDTTLYEGDAVVRNLDYSHYYVQHRYQPPAAARCSS